MIRIAAGDWSYTLTDDDVLWLARMAHWEGGDDPSDTIWAMLQSYAQPSKHRSFATFGLFLQGYSQPINPRWTRTGEFCRPGGRYHGRDECSEARLARRDRARSMSWDQIKPEVREKIARLEAGTLPNDVPRAVEFANEPVSLGFLERNPGATVIKRAGNWFIATESSRAWPADFVRVNGVGAREASWFVRALAVLGGSLVGAGLAYAALRR